MITKTIYKTLKTMLNINKNRKNNKLRIRHTHLTHGHLVKNQLATESTLDRVVLIVIH